MILPEDARCLYFDFAASEVGGEYRYMLPADAPLIGWRTTRSKHERCGQ